MRRKILISVLPLIMHFIVALFDNYMVTVLIFFAAICYVFGFFLKSKKELLLSIIAYSTLAFCINILEGNTLIKIYFYV